MNLIDAYTRLVAFRKNIPEKTVFGVEESYVKEYHDIISLLEKETGGDLTQFRVPSSAIIRRVSSSSYLTGAKEYTREKYCEKTILCMKVDALLLKFELEDKNTEIGFR
jgi:hypothetical protein